MPEDTLEGLRKLSRRAAEDRGPGRRGRHRRAKRIKRRWPRRTLITANILTAVSLVGAGGAYGYVQWRLGQIKRIAVKGLHDVGTSVQSPSSPGASIPPFTLLVIGSDTRNLGSASNAAFGSDTQVQGQRSDSIILVRVVPKTRSLALLSIPRDTLEPIPGMGTQRINAAFDTGNPSLLVTVLQQDFGIEVNHVVEFNFATFEQIANAVGGVQQWFPTPARDAFSLLNVPAAGCVNLVGAQALGFVRSREYQYYLNGQWNYQYYPESDLARIQRQQAFARDLLHKAKKIAPTNILELNNLVGSVTQNLTLDHGFSNSLLLSLAQDYRSASLANIPSYTYPAVNSQAQPGALDPQVSQGQAVITEWLAVGQPAPSSPTTTVPTSAATSTPPTTVVAPYAVSIEVQNGSGEANQASTVGQQLSAAGYRVTVSGDLPNSGLAITEIRYAPDSQAAAEQLQSELEGPSTLVEASSLTPTPYNLDVITGRNFTGFTAPAQAQTAPSTTTSTSTTVAAAPYAGTATVNPQSSSIYHGVYVPPGLVAGQQPQTCGE